MDTITGLVIDSILALLLIGAMTSSYFVYKRLGAIRSGQEELRTLVQQLNKATGEAQASVQHLKSMSIDAEEKIGVEIRRAKAMADELSMITEAGNNLASRIEGGLTSGRGNGSASNKRRNAGAAAQGSGSVKPEDILSVEKMVKSALKEEEAQSQAKPQDIETIAAREEQKALLDALKEAR